MSYRESSSSDRRASCRYPIERDVRYKIVDGRTVLTAGAGRTVDVSSGGILFTTEEPLENWMRLEVAVDWPVCLDNGCPLKLVAQGRVVRADGSQAAIEIEKYEFRTHGARAFTPAKTGQDPTAALA